MRFLTHGPAALFALLTLVSATPTLIERQSGATAVYKSGVSDAWIETLAVRANGQVLLTRLDVPELWSYDPTSKAGTKIATFPNAASLSGIGEVTPDVFAVVSGNFSTKSVSFKTGSWAVWKVDLTGAAPKTTLIKSFADSEFFIGVAGLNNDTVLVGDAAKGSLISLTLSTGVSSVVLTDPSMKAPANAFIQEGIHGLKYSNGYAYFTNTFGNSFNKLQVDPVTAKAVGAVVPIVTTGLNNPESFTITSDGTAYIAQLGGSNIIKITSDGKVTTVTPAASCSGCAFGRTAADKDTLYISTSTGSLLTAAVSV